AVIHDPPVGAEGGGVRAHKALCEACGRALGIDAIEAAQRLRLHAVRGARPESALPVAFRVVEADVRASLDRIDQRPSPPHVGRENVIPSAAARASPPPLYPTSPPSWGGRSRSNFTSVPVAGSKRWISGRIWSSQ